MVNGIWVSADRWTPNKYADDECEPPVRVEYEDRIYSGRNYSLFAILADVRNGRGFAGCDTGDGFVPIDDPRGIPDDVSDSVKADADRWDADGHSHSWLTVAEMLAYDWTQTTKQRGFVSAPEFWKWNRWNRKNGESPDSYCGGVGGAGIRKVSEQEMIQLLEPFGNEWSAQERIENELSSVYCQAEWEQPYYKAVRHFLSDTMPRLWQLGKPDEVRLVFWFDN
jgi:hypothetical protein